MASPTFPYDHIAPSRVWRQSVAHKNSHDIDPHLEPRFRLNRETRIASAGSCFALRIAEGLRQNGFNYRVVEQGPPFLDADKKRLYNYGTYSARYGNIYTTLQLLQLFQRAFDMFAPSDSIWRTPGGEYVDAFRPRIQPDGFAAVDELIADRDAHLAATRQLFQTMDVFIFTLGLTETWCSTVDDAAYPVCPGKDFGVFDTSKYYFTNISLFDNLRYFSRFLELLKMVNSAARVILTVSPVPLVATAENRHVLQATTYSKSVLRVLAEEAVRAHDNVEYFASYEIITSTFNDAAYFADDRRTVTDAGVGHVMRSFFDNFTETAPALAVTLTESDAREVPAHDPCDEDILARHIAENFRN